MNTVAGNTRLFGAVILAALVSCSLFQQTRAYYHHETQPSETSTGASRQADQRVKLGVFIESLCPDSRRFFVRQLVPTYRELGAIMELEIVPFGHARCLGNGKMICQHGPRECEGNRRMACIQAAALARGGNQSELVETLGCLFRDDDSAQTCVSSNMNGADYGEIEKCTKADESYQMMVAAEKTTGQLTYVPHLTVNGESSDHIQDQAEHELKRFVCQQYKGQSQMDACKDFAQAQ